MTAMGDFDKIRAMMRPAKMDRHMLAAYEAKAKATASPESQAISAAPSEITHIPPTSDLGKAFAEAHKRLTNGPH